MSLVLLEFIGWEESRGCYSKVTISHGKRENNPNLFGNFRVIRPLRPASAASRVEGCAVTSMAVSFLLGPDLPNEASASRAL
jgi:hypothetical protein